MSQNGVVLAAIDETQSLFKKGKKFDLHSISSV